MSRASELIKVLEMQGQGTDREGAGGTDTCVCPKCGYEEQHDRGTPCNKRSCPKCGALMTGKGAPGDKTNQSDELSSQHVAFGNVQT